MQLSPENYSHGNKPRFTKGCFPPKNSFGWDFSVSGCDGQIHSFDMNFTPRRFQVGLSPVVYGAFEAAGKTAFFFIPILKKPQLFMQNSNLQSEEEKSIIIEIPSKSKIRFLWAVNTPSSTQNSLVLNISQEDVCVTAVIIVLLFTQSFLLSLSKYVQKEQFSFNAMSWKEFLRIWMGAGCGCSVRCQGFKIHAHSIQQCHQEFQWWFWNTLNSQISIYSAESMTANAYCCWQQLSLGSKYSGGCLLGGSSDDSSR